VTPACSNPPKLVSTSHGRRSAQKTPTPARRSPPAAVIPARRRRSASISLLRHQGDGDRFRVLIRQFRHGVAHSIRLAGKRDRPCIQPAAERGLHVAFGQQPRKEPEWIEFRAVAAGAEIASSAVPSPFGRGQGEGRKIGKPFRPPLLPCRLIEHPHRPLLALSLNLVERASSSPRTKLSSNLLPTTGRKMEGRKMGIRLGDFPAPNLPASSCCPVTSRQPAPMGQGNVGQGNPFLCPKFLCPSPVDLRLESDATDGRSRTPNPDYLSADFSDSVPSSSTNGNASDLQFTLLLATCWGLISGFLRSAPWRGGACGFGSGPVP